MAIIYKDNKQGKLISKDKRTTRTHLAVRIRERNDIETPWEKKNRLHGAENYIKMLTPRRDWKLGNR